VNRTKRDERLRLLVARLNKERKKQAKQIDILCNDIIAAQRQFIKDLAVLSFAANFYEATAGAADLRELLYIAASFIRQEIVDANVAFFIQRQGSSELHIFEGEQVGGEDEARLENCFTNELVNAVAKSNRICSIEDMLGLGLEASPVFLRRFSVYAIPLAHKGLSRGFILLYRSSRNPLSADELKRVCGITTGLSRSVGSCKTLVPAVPTDGDG